MVRQQLAKLANQKRQCYHLLTLQNVRTNLPSEVSGSRISGERRKSGHGKKIIKEKTKKEKGGISTLSSRISGSSFLPADSRASALIFFHSYYAASLMTRNQTLLIITSSLTPPHSIPYF